MNFVGRFADILPGDVVRDGASVRVDAAATHVPPGAIVVDDAQLLFAGDFKRSGVDLILSTGDREVVLPDYFKGEKRAALATPDGAHLTGDIVNALAGSVQLAQADGSASAAKVIGHVTKLTGTATAIRNGVAITLHQGDNVHQGDVVQSGSESTLGITFIDGTVFGLGANARMVLNEMVYDPNGTKNSALLSLVQGTISFVAGATAKHGDMKVDTPVATMGIRGTAVLVEIDFEIIDQLVVPAPERLAGPLAAKFQVLMEPDGTTGSYILFDKTTLTPLATVNRVGTQTVINALGNVSVSSAKLSNEAQKLITDVFALRFTDNSNPNTKLTNFTDSIVPTSTGPIKLADGTYIYPTVYVGVGLEQAPNSPNNGPGDRLDHIPGPPTVVASSGDFTERDGTNNPDLDTVTGTIHYADINVGDVPTASAKFSSFTYKVGDQDVTASLSDTQRAAIAAVDVPLKIVQDPAHKNSGVATWTYEVSDHDFDFLAEGETLTLTYIVRVDNNFAPHNEFTEVPVTVTVTGTNDAPVIAVDTSGEGGTGLHAIMERADTTGNSSDDTAGGSLAFRDVDLTDTHTVAQSAPGFVWLDSEGEPLSLSEQQMSALAAASTLTLTPQDSTGSGDGSVAFSYAAANSAFDFLAEGETLTVTYNVTVTDNHGVSSTQPVTVTVTGTNDAPVIAVDTSGEGGTGLHGITERADTTGDSSDDTAGGSLAFRDVDLTDTHTVTKSAPGFVWLDSEGEPLSLSEQQKSALADASTLTLTPQDSTGSGDGSVAFSYAAANSAFDFLAEGETLTVTYNVTITDNHGVSSTQPVTVTVTGTNDAPVAVADSDTGNIVEAGNDVYGDALPGVATTTGNVLTNDTDVDITDTHEVVGVAAGTEGGAPSGGVGAPIAGTYGSLVLNADGSWTYTLDNDNAATDALAQDQEVSDVFTYTESDGHGGTSTTTLTINITGTNDAPVANAPPSAAADTNAGPPVVEAGVTSGNTSAVGVDGASGNVLANDLDVDAGDTRTVQGVASGEVDGPLTGDVATTVAGLYGSVTVDADGTWTYTLDNSNAATQALTEGEHVSDVFTYTMRDTLGATSSATLVIDITGANDAPTLADVPAGTLTDTAASDSFSDLTGTLSGNDVDTGETASLHYAALDNGEAVTTAVAGDYGSLTVNESGSYVYVPDAAAINALPAGDYSDTFTVQTVDEHGATGTATLTVQVTGANDAPTLADVPAGTLTDTAASDSFSDLTGTLSGNDVDTGETASLHYAALDNGEAVTTAVAGDYGSLTVNESGSYVYVPDAAAINALPAGDYSDTFTVQTVDEHGATGTATLTVQVTGANDAPTLADVPAGTLTDTDVSDSFADLTGTLAGTDADSGETQSLQYAALDANGRPVTTVAGDYGSLTVNANGSYIYVANAAAINALPAGEYSDTFTVQTVDEHGAIGTATLTVQVTGANDAPTLADVPAGTLTDTAASDSFTDLMGTLAGTDADSGETQSLQYAALDSNGDPVTTAVVGDYGSLTVNANGSYVYVPNAAAINALPEGNQNDTFTVQVVDEHGATGTATLTVQVAGANDAPVINVNDLSVTYNENGTTTVSGLSVTDVDAAPDENFTVTATTDDPGSLVTPSSDTGPLAEINSTLQTGGTYDKADATSATDMVTVTVTDGHGATDAVNFVFSIAENPTSPVVLTGTEGRDVYVGTEQSEQFVFGAGSNHDTIMNFQTGQDSIDLSTVAAPNDLEVWYGQNVQPSSTNPDDTVITISATDTITLHNATVHQSDFVFFNV